MSLKQSIQKRAKKLLILNLVFIIAGLAGIGYAFSRKDVTESFKGATEVHTYDELNVARYNSKYVKVYFTDAFETGYIYKYDGKVVAKYIDFDMDGYSLVAVVKSEEAKKILNGEQNYIEGRLEKFTGEHKSAYDDYVKDYVNKFKNEYKPSEDGEEASEEKYTEEELKSIFVPIQLNNYEYESYIGAIYVLLVGIGIVILICLINVLRAILKIKAPFKKFRRRRSCTKYNR